MLLNIVSYINKAMIIVSLVYVVIAFFETTMKNALVFLSLVILSQILIEKSAPVLMKITTTPQEKNIYLLTGGSSLSSKDELILILFGIINILLKIILIILFYYQV